MQGATTRYAKKIDLTPFTPVSNTDSITLVVFRAPSVTVETLGKIADALNFKIVIKLQHKKEATAR